MRDQFTPRDHWKSLVLYGLNTATYKIAFGKTLLGVAQAGEWSVTWEQLSKAFLDHYIARLCVESPMPQMSYEGRLTVMERIVAKHTVGAIDCGAAVAEVGLRAFDDVVRRFQNLGRMDFRGMFYQFEHGKSLSLCLASDGNGKTSRMG